MSNLEKRLEKATFAAGCFWGVEEAFRKTHGVKSTKVGYTAGSTPNPTYEEVCTDMTGHAEAIQIEYDPKQVSYDELLKLFWSIHDPTTKDRQGPDIGKQYRSMIAYHSPDQESAARKSMELLDRSGKLRNKIVTEIIPTSQFFPAEEYHQRYYEKRGGGACYV